MIGEDLKKKLVLIMFVDQMKNAWCGVHMDPVCSLVSG